MEASKSNEASNSNETILIKTSDGELFTVDKKTMYLSTLIKNMYEDLDIDSGEILPLGEVNSKLFSKILVYCEHHKDDVLENEDVEKSIKQPDSNDMTEWDREFIGSDIEELFELIKTANYLDIKNLLELGCKAVANLIKDKSVEEIREILGVENDFSPEEEDAAKKSLLDTDLSKTEIVSEENKKEVKENDLAASLNNSTIE